MAEDRLRRLRELIGRRGGSVEKKCCATHRLSLLKESVGLPLLALADLNFLQCFDCRPTQHETLMYNADSASAPSPSLDDFFHEYSSAISVRSLRRSQAFYPETQESRKHSSCRALSKPAIIEDYEEGDDDDVHLADAEDDDECEGQLPHHLLLSDLVLSHLPLVDIIRARHVSRAWMSTIDAVLQNPRSRAHVYIRRPCLMLLHPRSEKTGTCAALSVFEFSSNAWLTKPILFPSKASYLVGTSLGLFCFATGNSFRSDSYMHDPFKTKISFMDKNVNFFVGNPLTETWTCLLRPPSTHCKCAGNDEVAMFAFVAYTDPNSPCSLCYKLIKVQPRKKRQTSNNIYIYDSCTRRWDKDRFQGWSIEHIVFETPELLHCFNKYGSLECSYNLVTHTSKKYLQDNTQYYRGGGPYGLPFGVWCAERSFCVRRMLYGEFEHAFVGLIPFISHKWPVGVYRLGDNARWELVSQMPPNLLKEAVEKGSDGTDFVIGSDHTRRIFFILKGSSKMLVFDVLSSDWNTLPGCTFVPSFYPYKLHAFCEPLI